MPGIANASVGRFEELDYVFGHACTVPMARERETHLGESLWQRRRRLELAWIWLENPNHFQGTPPGVSAHRAPLPTSAVRRWLAAEKRARDHIERPDLTSRARAWLVPELDAIDVEREELFQRNLRLVAWIARGFLAKGLDLPDLFQEGAMALLNAVQRFDPHRGARLATFASHAIRLGLVRALAERGRPIRIPNYRIKEIVDATKARAALMGRLGREPRVEEIQKETGLSAAAIEEVVPAIRPILSTDAPLPGSDIAMSDILSDETQPSPYERVLAAETRERAQRALSRLPERERRIVAMRYGLLDDEEHTFEEIGRVMGLSRERTRQLEKSARKRMLTRLQGAAAS